MTETVYSAEYLQDGVYSLTTTTRYNAAGQPLTRVQKQLISQLSATIENKSVFVSERGLTSTQWTVYSGGTKRVQYSTVPGSAITAETVTVDDVVFSQKDTAGITTTATRRLSIQKNGTWFSAPSRLAKQGVRSQVCSRLGGWLLKPHPAYGLDLTKNICELYGPSGYIRTAYNYTPYGQVSSTGDVEQPIQWSSEFNDTELGLIYYNYRHYNPVDGRWLGRDKKDSATGNHIYAYVSNFPVLHGDQLGEDRYYYCYSGDIGLHGVLIIDNWKKVCKYEKRTPVEYGLQPEDVKYFDNLIDVFLTYVNTFHILHIEYYYTIPFSRIMYINAYIKRRLYRDPIPKSAEIIKSTPEEDMEEHNILTEEMKSNQPYNLIFSNCHHWAIDNKYIVMKENK